MAGRLDALGAWPYLRHGPLGLRHTGNPGEPQTLEPWARRSARVRLELTLVADVMLGVAPDRDGLFVRRRSPDAPRAPHHERPGWNRRPLGDEGTGRNDRPGADDHTVQHDRADPDEAAVLDAHPWRIAPCPTVTSSPMSVGCVLRITWTTLPSWMLVLSSPISTSPITCALSSTNAVGATRGKPARWDRSIGANYTSNRPLHPSNGPPSGPCHNGPVKNNFTFLAADPARTGRRSTMLYRGRVLPVCSLLAHGGTTAAWCSGPSVRGRIYDTGCSGTRGVA